MTPNARVHLVFVLLAILIVLLAALPVIGVALASGAASWLDCDLDEGSVHPCLWLGMDIGGALYALFVLGWLGLGTLPLGAIGLGVLAIAWIVVTALQLRERAQARRKGL